MTDHTHANPAHRYFESQADGYTAGSSRGLWRLLRKWETAAVLDLARPEPAQAILDAGSGSGHYTAALLARGATVTALDGSAAMLDSLRSRLAVRTIHADLAAARLEPEFDQIICAGVLEFVPDPAAALANLRTGLRPGGPGRITILVPYRWIGGRMYQSFHRRHGVPVTLFGHDDLARLAHGLGLRVKATRRATFNIVARFETASGSSAATRPG